MQHKHKNKIKVYHRKKAKRSEIVEVFIGKNTLFSLLGFSVGGILVGRSLWQYGHDYLGLPMTITIGATIFVISGIVLGRFYK